MSQVVTLVELDPIESNVPSIVFNRASARSPDEGDRNTEDPQSVESSTQFLPKGRTIIVIATLAGINLLNCISLGFLTVGLPSVAVDVKLPKHLLLWYEISCLNLASFGWLHLMPSLRPDIC
jgi:hypothetical protein